jgi:heterodisulfide reductase subunit A
LIVQYKDSGDQGSTVEVDMVILTPAIEPRVDAANLAKILEITQDETGFFKEEHPELASVNSSKEGVFIAGCAQGPKDIQNSVAQAEAAVGKVLSKLT